jgi:hypothetical protein
MGYLVHFLYHESGALPIWASRDYIRQTMPQHLKRIYPNTRVINYTEQRIEIPTAFRSQSAFLRMGTSPHQFQIMLALQNDITSSQDCTKPWSSVLTNNPH